MDTQIACILAMQESVPQLVPFFSGFSFLGLPEFYLLVIPLILWCYDWSLGLRIVLLLSISGAVSDILKTAFHTPRPYWMNMEVKAFSEYPSFGFPSSHAGNAVVFFGLIAATIRKKWIIIVSILCILLIGVARVFQAVHFPTDIIGGYAVGIVLLLLFLRYESRISLYLSDKSIGFQVILVFAISCLFVLLSFLALLSLGSWKVPEEWSVLALSASGVPINPLFPRDTLMSAGLLFGSASGALINSRYIHYSPVGKGPQKIARYLIGIVILFVLWNALGVLVHFPGPGGYIMEYIRPALAGLWILAGAPFLFKKLEIAW